MRGIVTILVFLDQQARSENETVSTTTVVKPDLLSSSKHETCRAPSLGGREPASRSGGKAWPARLMTSCSFSPFHSTVASSHQSHATDGVGILNAKTVAERHCQWAPRCSKYRSIISVQSTHESVVGDAICCRHTMSVRWLIFGAAPTILSFLL